MAEAIRKQLERLEARLFGMGAHDPATRDVQNEDSGGPPLLPPGPFRSGLWGRIRSRDPDSR